MLRPVVRARLQGAFIGAGAIILMWTFFGLTPSEKVIIYNFVPAPERLAQQISRRCPSPGDLSHAPSLSFRTCGDFAQERVSLMMGLTIGWLMNRTVIWPQVRLHAAPEIALPPFVSQPAPGEREAIAINLKRQPPAYYRLLAVKSINTPHIDFDCAFLSLDASLELEVARFLWHVHDALQPSSAVATLRDQIIAAGKSDGCLLAVVSVLNDAQWNTHCVRYDRQGSCVANATRAAILLAEASLPKRYPVLLVNSLATSARRFTELLDIEYAVPTRQLLAGADADVLTAAEYLGSLAADIYVGHSTLLSSAMVLLRRLDDWQSVMWHNGGGLPSLLPSVRLMQSRYAPLPWLVYFTQQAAQDSAQLLQLKRAVNSALERGAVRPYCLYDGTPDSVSAWLQERGVNVIFVTTPSSSSFFSFSSSASSPNSIASPWSTILSSLPAMSRLEPVSKAELALLLTAVTHVWQHVLLREEEAIIITSSAVLFRSQLTLAPLGTHIGTLSCGATDAAVLPGRLYPSFECDPSVLLLRTTITRGDEFASMYEWVKTAKEASTMTLAVGAINAGFTNALASLSPVWAWKPYWSGHTSDALLVHFAGAAGAASYGTHHALRPGECAASRASCDYWLNVWEDVSAV